MTYYLNLRSGWDNQAFLESDAVFLQGDPESDRPPMRPVPRTDIPRLFQGREVLFATHGFNVSYVSGLRALGRLESALNLPSSTRFVGVLWPGDFWLPVINYPAEAADAVKSGRRLAAFVDRWCAQATAVSFVSHSLGARLVLEAVIRMKRDAKEVCVTAAAMDADTLSAHYAAAARKARRTTILASRRDRVLALAYPLGDFVSDILYDDDSPFRTALGRAGPNPRLTPPVEHTQIHDADGYDHGHYFPPSAFPRPSDNPQDRWRGAVGYIERAVKGQPVYWP